MTYHPKALVLAQSWSDNVVFQRILSATAGIIFLGTPHFGAPGAAMLSSIASIANNMGMDWDKTLLKVIEDGSTELWSLEKQFAQVSHLMELVCFHETKKSSLFGVVRENSLVRTTLN
jgi:hypothetical protein